MDKYAAFYWTFPAPIWAMMKPPANINEMAARSKTIRYQRAAALKYAADGTIDREYYAIEDYGCAMFCEIEKVIGKCRNDGFILLFVDFGSGQMVSDGRAQHIWRDHSELLHHLLKSKVCCQALPPEPIMMDRGDGTLELFDPIEHFKRWNDVSSRAAARHERRLFLTERILNAIQALQKRDEQPTYKTILRQLKAVGCSQGMRGPFTPDSLRVFMRDLGIKLSDGSIPESSG